MVMMGHTITGAVFGAALTLALGLGWWAILGYLIGGWVGLGYAAWINIRNYEDAHPVLMPGE